MFTINSTRSAELDNAHNAWRSAAKEAADALHAWWAGPRKARKTACAVYRAALDREEQAARILAMHAR